MNGTDTARAEAGSRVREAVERFLPAWFEGSWTDDLALGSEGIGLDSVAIVELLVHCEESLGVAFPDSLLESRLTVGRLVDHLARAIGDGGRELSA